ncbi:hypothetical protein E8E14_007215 [Neopestalotiopsis sp. 37M]|nr:hypothetical protein E8E14_007215 [Neopestalotiopsis sp. 37M]
MPLTLTSLPLELVREVASWLQLPDQVVLCRTCKTLNTLLTPMVWSSIELHHGGTHEGIDISGEIENFEWKGAEWRDPLQELSYKDSTDDTYPYHSQLREPSSRKYAECVFDPTYWINEDWTKSYRLKENRKISIAPSRTPARSEQSENNQFGREEKFIGVPKVTTKERWNQLALCVNSLCMSVGVDDEVVDLIASLKNLRSLELIGFAKKEVHAPTARDITLPRLENLKLRGYFPSALVRKICNNAEQIKYLGLGLLATPTDDEAYKDTLLAARGTRAPVTLAQAEHYQQNGAETQANCASNITTNDADINDAEDEEGNKYEIEEWCDVEEQWPWALHAPIWLPRRLPSRLVSLTHLHLVKPCSGETSIDARCDGFSEIPHRYEQVLCIEWQLLLEAVGPFLKELILEHRAPAAYVDTVEDGDPVPLEKRPRDWSYDGPRDNDRGDELFCRSVLRLLLEQSSRFSKLRHLALRGIRIKGLTTQTDSDMVPGQGSSPDNDEILRKAYPDCEVELFEDAYPLHADAHSVYEPSWGDTHTAVQDEGDGLLWSLRFYHDYKKRFGPQWRAHEHLKTNTPNHIQPFRVPLAQEELNDPEAATQRQMRDREAVVELWTEETIAHNLPNLEAPANYWKMSRKATTEAENDDDDNDVDDKEEKMDDEDEEDEDGWCLVSAPTSYAEDGCVYLGELVRGVTFPLGLGCPRGEVREVLADLNDAGREMLGLPSGAPPSLEGDETESASSLLTPQSYE